MAQSNAKPASPQQGSGSTQPQQQQGGSTGSQQQSGQIFRDWASI